MAIAVTCGAWVIDGPPPDVPLFGLLQSARPNSTPVRINPPNDLLDAGGVQRWIGGVEVYPYPTNEAFVWNGLAPGSERIPKESGTVLPRPTFGTFTVYLPIRCLARSIPDQEAFRARALRAFEAYEGSAVEREFLAGEELTLNPYLADGGGVYPLAETPTSIANGLALLENEIARAGGQGIIHCSPGFASAASVNGLAIREETRLLHTVNGTLVIPGQGYVAGAAPAGYAAAGGTTEWVYATGPIDVYRTDPEIIPDDVMAALDRGLGGRTDEIEYRVEREYVVVWDTRLQAAVKIDRCKTTC